VIIFKKNQTGSWFLAVRWLDTALDFSISAIDTIQSSVKPEHSRTPSLPQNVLGNCTTWARELTENLLLPFLRVFASSRETLPQGHPSDVQPMSAGFSPDTSAAAFPPKSTFAFTPWVKPSKFQNPYHGPIGSASVDFQPFFNCGL
jgi:hypothetical protein